MRQNDFSNKSYGNDLDVLNPCLSQSNPPLADPTRTTPGNPKLPQDYFSEAVQVLHDLICGREGVPGPHVVLYELAEIATVGSLLVTPSLH